MGRRLMVEIMIDEIAHRQIPDYGNPQAGSCADLADPSGRAGFMAGGPVHPRPD